MKKQVLLVFSSLFLMLLTFTTQAQDSKMDENPVYEQFNDKCILDKVEYRTDRTIFHFRYKASTYTSIWLYAPNGAHPWFLKDEINGEEYKLLGVYNVRRNNKMIYKEIKDNVVYMNADEKKEKTYFECEVHFERMPMHVSEVDLIEGKGMESAWNHFHCFNIKISPLKTQEDVVVAPVDMTEVVIFNETTNALQEPASIEVIAPVQEGGEVVVVENTTDEAPNTSKLEVTQTTDWSVFPTPATTILNVKQTTNQTAQLALVTVAGQTVWTGRITGTATTINVSNLAAGAYFLQHTVNGVVTSQKVLINK